MSKVGFGAYRITTKVEEHGKALKHALNLGITLIDTSSNYGDGESEELIGKILKTHWQSKPLVVSKVGYAQGKNLEIIKDFPKDVVEVSNDLKHSIHPDFIDDQVSRSIQKLCIPKIDIYLLQNPEYYLKSEGSTKKEFYKRIKLAFDKMEDLVQQGRIGSYGVSANTFVDPKEEHEAVDLDIIFEIAKSIKKDHSFKYIQFPMNILEVGALERQYGGENLISHAQSLGLKTMINRPLNCFSEQGLLRLATYDIDPLYENHDKAEELFTKGIEPLVIKWLEVREDDGDKLFDIPVLKQIRDIWFKQNSSDGVDQVFIGHFFPLIANIWGSDLTAEQSQTFYDLYDHAKQFALGNMNKRSKEFEKQAISKGLIFDSDKTLSQKVLEKYESFGVDYILVGMRQVAYVDDFKDYL